MRDRRVYDPSPCCSALFLRRGFRWSRINPTNRPPSSPPRDRAAPLSSIPIAAVGPDPGASPCDRDSYDYAGGLSAEDWRDQLFYTALILLRSALESTGIQRAQSPFPNPLPEGEEGPAPQAWEVRGYGVRRRAGTPAGSVTPQPPTAARRAPPSPSGRRVRSGAPPPSRRREASLNLAARRSLV